MMNEPTVDIARLRSGMICLYTAAAFLAAVLGNLPELRGGVHPALWVACAVLGAIPTIAAGSWIAVTVLRLPGKSWLASPRALDLLAAAVLCHWLLIGSTTCLVFRFVSGYRGWPLSACLASTGLVLMGMVLPERHRHRRSASNAAHAINHTTQTEK